MPGVFVRLTGDCRFQIQTARADRQVGRRVANSGQVIEVTMSVAGLAFRRRAKDRSDVVLPFDVGLAREIQISSICLRLAGKRGLEVIVSLAALEIHRILLMWDMLVQHRNRRGEPP
jgi:hypothetical protein